MTIETARVLLLSGRSHGLASDLLYRSAVVEGQDKGVADPDLYAFNGPHSLSIHYLVGLSLELLLKAAYVAAGGPGDVRHLRNAIGHDLLVALEMAEQQGFHSEAPHLHEIVGHMNEPYKNHHFRYDQPNEIALPDFNQMLEAIAILDEELRTICHR